MAVNKVVYDGATLVDLTGDTVTADNLAAGVKATGADGKPIVGLLPKVTIDAELSDTSENPVQNKIIYKALQGKADTSIFNGFALSGPAKRIVWREVGQILASIDATNYTGNAATATKATQDGAGNVIVDTYAKKTELTAAIPTKLSTLKNDSGYLTMATLPAFATTDTINRWTERQTFNEAYIVKSVLKNVAINQELYSMECVSGTAITPTKSTMCLTATGATTLDMSTIVADCLYSKKSSTIFTAYIKSDVDYTLTITNAGTIKYIGSASDVAITSAGLLLNIMLMKDASGNVTSIVQASKLEGGA